MVRGLELRVRRRVGYGGLEMPEGAGLDVGAVSKGAWLRVMDYGQGGLLQIRWVFSFPSGRLN